MSDIWKWRAAAYLVVFQLHAETVVGGEELAVSRLTLFQLRLQLRLVVATHLLELLQLLLSFLSTVNTHTHTQWQERVIMQVFGMRIIWVYTNKTSVITLMFPVKTLRRRWNGGFDQTCLVRQQTPTISQHTTTHLRHHRLNKNTTVMSLIEKQQECLQVIKLSDNEGVSVLIKQPRSSRKMISLVIFFSLTGLTGKIQKTFVKTITNHKWGVFFPPLCF